MENNSSRAWTEVKLETEEPIETLITAQKKNQSLPGPEMIQKILRNIAESPHRFLRTVRPGHSRIYKKISLCSRTGFYAQCCTGLVEPMTVLTLPSTQ
jgi:hypothetical protein